MFYDRNEFDPHAQASWEPIDTSVEIEEKEVIQCQDCVYGLPCQYQGLLQCGYHSEGIDMPEIVFVKFMGTCNKASKN